MAERLLSPEREQKILAALKEARVMSVTSLSEALEVSEATVRRDLQSLHERKLLRRVRGGAAVNSLNRAEPLFSDKETTQEAEKQRIAAVALALVEDHETIYLDGGSTVMKFARLLDGRQDLTIVTNSLMAASSLMSSGHRLILVGGEFRALSRTLVGPLTATVIRSLNVDKAFMGTIGFSIPDGMTTTDPNEAFTKEQIMLRANQVILLVDSSKLGIPSFARSGSLQDIDIVVTDSIVPAFRHDLEAHGIRVLVAEK